MVMSNENATYLGDAVYADFDGYGVNLKLNDHRSESLIYMEPEIIQALVKFYCIQTNQSVKDFILS